MPKASRRNSSLLFSFVLRIICSYGDEGKQMQSAYHKALAYLELEVYKLWQEGYNTKEEYLESMEGLKELSASEIMKMYKAWKESDI